jgi:hypothetical protein
VIVGCRRDRYRPTRRASGGSGSGEGGPAVRKLLTIGVVTAIAGAAWIVPAGAAVTPEVKAFCKAVNRADAAVEAASGDEATPRQQRAVDPALTGIEETAPPELATVVSSVTGILRASAQSGADPFEDPALLTGITTIDAYRFAQCGYDHQIETVGREYEFVGFPKRVERGKVAIKFTNEGAELHELALYRFKGDDTIDELLELNEKKARKRVVEVDSTLAEQGQSSYMFAKLARPGRYFVACFLPVGSTSFAALETADGAPHAVEGMAQQFRVTG